MRWKARADAFEVTYARVDKRVDVLNTRQWRCPDVGRGRDEGDACGNVFQGSLDIVTECRTDSVISWKYQVLAKDRYNDFIT